MRHLVRVSHRRLKEKDRESFDALFDNPKLRQYIYRQYDNDVIIYVPLFNRLQYDFEVEKPLKQLRFSLLAVDEAENVEVILNDFSAKDPEYDEMLRSIRYA